MNPEDLQWKYFQPDGYTDAAVDEFARYIWTV